MSNLRAAAQRALAFTMRDFATMRDFEAARAVLHDDLRAALKQEEEASAWLSERKEHWRKEREKMQATKDQDPELSAALGWPGGTSDPVLDRTRLLQMVAALRVASKQALEALQWHYRQGHSNTLGGLRLKIDEKALRNLRAALAQQPEPVAWVECDGELVWNNREAAIGRNLYTTPPQRPAEPVQEPRKFDHGIGADRFKVVRGPAYRGAF
jgi:hypothetical protein